MNIQQICRRSVPLYIFLAFVNVTAFLSLDVLGADMSFVINAHGAKTTKSFDMSKVGSAVDLYTPEDLHTAYLYKDDGRNPKGIENIFQSGKLPGYAKSTSITSWHHYSNITSDEVPDVVFTPLNFDKNLSLGESGTTRELKYFKENITTKTTHWAYDTGGDAILFVRSHGQIEQVIGHARIKSYMEEYSTLPAAYDEDNAPLILFVPKHSKVKVLGKTSLSEVIAKLDETFGNGGARKVRLLMAACNASSGIDQVVSLSTDVDKAQEISTLFH